VILASSIDWTSVLVAFVAGLPALIAAIGVLLVHAQIRTPSGQSIGRQIEGAHHVAIANNQRLVAINEKLHAPQSALGHDEEQHVPKLVENGQGNDGEH
jgi:hypothetical protein